MPLTPINAQLGRSKKFLKKCVSPKVVSERVKEVALKKVIPTTMIVAESLSPVSVHADDYSKSIASGLNYWNSGHLKHFVPRKIAKSKLLPPIGRSSYMPWNNFNKNSDCVRKSYKGTAEQLDYFIESLIPKKDGKKDYNPFYKKGKSFIEIGKKYNVNPTVLVAIGMQESGRGTSYAAMKKNNIGGIMLKSGHAEFKSVDDCIAKMAEIIDRRANENCKSIEKIGQSGKYCAKSVADLWVKNVVYFLNQM